jgi:hypothetical protein
MLIGDWYMRLHWDEQDSAFDTCFGRYLSVKQNNLNSLSWRSREPCLENCHCRRSAMPIREAPLKDRC